MLFRDFRPFPKVTSDTRNLGLKTAKKWPGAGGPETGGRKPRDRGPEAQAKSGGPEARSRSRVRSPPRHPHQGPFPSSAPLPGFVPPVCSFIRPPRQFAQEPLITTTTSPQDALLRPRVVAFPAVVAYGVPLAPYSACGAGGSAPIGPR